MRFQTKKPEPLVRALKHFDKIAADYKPGKNDLETEDALTALRKKLEAEPPQLCTWKARFVRVESWKQDVLTITVVPPRLPGNRFFPDKTIRVRMSRADAKALKHRGLVEIEATLTTTRDIIGGNWTSVSSYPTKGERVATWAHTQFGRHYKSAIRPTQYRVKLAGKWYDGAWPVKKP